MAGASGKNGFGHPERWSKADVQAQQAKRLDLDQVETNPELNK
jgi:hypothetical protein